MENWGDNEDSASYSIGVDLGANVVVVAVARGKDHYVAALGESAPEMPASIFLGQDGDVLVGSDAEDAARHEPTLVARNFRHSIGIDDPVVIGGQSYTAEALAAATLRTIVDRIAKFEGGPPRQIAFAVPDHWGPSRRERLSEAFWNGGVGDVLLVPATEAAAVRHDHLDRLVVGSNVLVFHFDDDSFTATVQNRTVNGLKVAGEPVVRDGLGQQVNRELLSFVLSLLGDRLKGVDPDALEVNAALLEMERELTSAKRILAVEEGTGIHVPIPGSRTTMWLTRTRLEQTIVPIVEEALEATRQAVEGAYLAFDQIDLIVMSGENARLPLVLNRVETEFRCQLAAEMEPGYTVALGAARAAAAMPSGQASFELSPPVAQAASATGYHGLAQTTSQTLSRVARSRVSMVILVVLAIEIGLSIGLLLREREPEPAEPPSQILVSPGARSQSG